MRVVVRCVMFAGCCLALGVWRVLCGVCCLVFASCCLLFVAQRLLFDVRYVFALLVPGCLW